MRTNKDAQRIPLLDELRGLSVLLMVLYHGVYDVLLTFGLRFPLFESPLVAGFLQPLFAGLFVFISGMVCWFSRSNRKRGALTFACALLITAVTLAVSPDYPDLFGILHLLGCCMLLFALAQPLLARLPARWGVPGLLALFFLCYRVPYEAFGIGALSIRLPHLWYTVYPLFFLGFPTNDFLSADYFPLIPWMFLFFAGSCLGLAAKNKALPAWVHRSRFPLLAKAGRHTLWIYLLHQPLIFGILLLLQK